MPFEAGKPKTGGRKAGRTNRNSPNIKGRIATLIDEQFENIVADLETLEPKERVAAYQKFLEYILPKQREQKIDLSSLSDAEVDQLLDKVLNKLDD